MTFKKTVAWVVLAFITLDEYLGNVLVWRDDIGNWAFVLAVLGTIGFWYIILWSLKNK